MNAATLTKASQVRTEAIPTQVAQKPVAVELERQRLEAWATIPNAGPIELSIVIPTYNESKRIVCTIAAIAAHIAPRYNNWELIIADDGSTDDTLNKIERLQLANLRILRTPHNAGKGAAVQRGIRAANANTVLFTDADLSTPINAIGDLIDSITLGADIAIGSRSLAHHKAHRSLTRKTLSHGLRIYQQLLIPTGVKDTQCGFKIFRRDAALEIFEHCQVDGFAFDIEMLYTAHRLNMTIDERPVEWIDAPGSKVRPIKDAIKFAHEMLNIRLRWETKHRGHRTAAKCRAAVA
jgi:dolichyl-phosphate beta-glucosyltransferase